MRRAHAQTLMILCLLVASWLRFIRLEDMPPGVHYDEAANGILAGDIGLRGERPIFIFSYTGKETLFFYLAGGMMAGVGESLFALRLTAAFISLLTIAGSYTLGRIIFNDRRVGLLAAILMGVSFWHLLFSRLGFRAISQPLTQTITMCALYLGMRDSNNGSLGRQRVWLTIAGIFLGATAYTYLAARIFPILFGLSLVPLITAAANRKKRWEQVGFVIFVAALVLAPLAFTFWRQPDAFWTRIRQVAPADAGINVGKQYLQSLGMLLWRGDPYIRFNLPMRPLFGWLGGLCLVGGWLALSLKKWGSDWRNAARWLLLLAPFIMILPTALATSEIARSNLRAIGLMPFIFYLPAFGAVAFIDQISPIFPPTRKETTRIWLWAIIVGCWMLAAGAVVYNAYFRDWGRSTDLFYELDGDLAGLAAYLEDDKFENEQIYVAARHYRHPTLAFLSDKYDQLHWLPNSEALPLPASADTTQIFYPQRSPMPDWGRPFLQSVPDDAIPLDSSGQPIFERYRLANPPPLAEFAPTAANFSHIVQLMGAKLPASPPTKSLSVILWWRIANLPPGDIAPFLHLEDQWGHRWSQTEPFAYPSEQWQAGDDFLLHADLSFPPGMPPGEYRLRLGWFFPETGEQLGLVDDAGRYAGNAAELNAIQIAGNPAPPTSPPPIAANASVNGLHLLGHDPLPTSIRSGEKLTVPLWWQADETPLPDYLVRFTIGGVDHQEMILWESAPVQGTLPFSAWSPGAFVIDRQQGRLPASAPPGEYQLTFWLVDEANQSQLNHTLGTIEVALSDRLFEPPPVQRPLNAAFGDDIQLLGYNLLDGNLTLIWQADRTPSADYTAFVHLLDEDSVCCLWQADRFPNQAPTSDWLPGKIVIDNYQLPASIPPDSVIEIGLYLAQSGQRLQIRLPDGAVSDKLELLP